MKNTSIREFGNEKRINSKILNSFHVPLRRGRLLIDIQIEDFDYSKSTMKVSCNSGALDEMERLLKEELNKFRFFCLI